VTATISMVSTGDVTMRTPILEKANRAHSGIDQ
jgi:hypothetical protein